MVISGAWSSSGANADLSAHFQNHPGALLFSVLLILATIGCYLGSFLSKPTDEETLLSFNEKVRPWSFWKPIYDKVEAQDPGFERNKNFKRDMVNVSRHCLANRAGGVAVLHRINEMDSFPPVRGHHRGDQLVPEKELAGQAGRLKQISFSCKGRGTMRPFYIVM
jgi:hypothetical protein